MALKTAKMFKDFLIAVNENNDAVTFSRRDEIDVYAKNDNFAAAVLVKTDSDIDLFDYKYITFDGNAVFEVTDVIKNANYYSLSVQYISNITFDEEDNNFYAHSISAQTLQRLGINMTEFLSMVGNNAVIELKDVSTLDNEEQKAFCVGVRLRFSEIPQNLDTVIAAYRDTRDNNIYLSRSTVTAPTNLGQNRSRVCVQNRADDADVTDGALFKQFDNAVTVFIPIPTESKHSIAVYTDENTNDYIPQEFTLSDFIETLNALITDLTLSAEITIIPYSDICIMTSGGDSVIPSVYSRVIGKSYTDSYGNSAYIIGVKVAAVDTATVTSSTFPANGFLRTIVNYQPIFVFEVGQSKTSTNAKYFDGGFWENNKPFKVFLPVNETTVAFSVTLLNNTIDISQLKNDFIELQRFSGKIRVWSDFDRNIYTDIQTSFEFAKNAYSNYDAYKSANLDLVQAQENATFKQMQEQARRSFNVSQVFSNIRGAVGTLEGGISGASGGAAGAIAGAVTGTAKGALSWGLSALEKTINFNMQQQNERANLRLAQAQARETATQTIIPSSDLSGSLSFLTAFATDISTGKYAYFALRVATISDTQLRFFEKSAFSEMILDRITNANDIVRPVWQTLHNVYQLHLANKNPLNNRKDLILYAYGGAWAFAAKYAYLTAGTRGLPNVHNDETQFVGNLSNNANAGITFQLTAREETSATLTAYVTGRKQGARPFASGWTTRVNGIILDTDAVVPQGDYATEWTKSYPVTLGTITLKKGANDISFTVPTNVGDADASNFDKIEIDCYDGVIWRIKNDNSIS